MDRRAQARNRRRFNIGDTVRYGDRDARIVGTGRDRWTGGNTSTIEYWRNGRNVQGGVPDSALRESDVYPSYNQQQASSDARRLERVKNAANNMLANIGG